MRSTICLLSVLAASALGEDRRCGLEALYARGWTPSASHAAGASARQAAARRLSDSPSSLQTEHFILWWTASGTHAIQGTQAKAVASGDSVPALVRAGASALERAWLLYVDTLGYDAPKSSGKGYYWGLVAPTGKYPVEFCNIAVAEGFSGCFGLTYPDTDGTSAMLLGSNVANFGTWSYGRDVGGGIVSEDYSTTWDTAIQASAAHEEFHAVQFNYEVPVSDLHVLYEASALAMEKRAIPWERDYLYFSESLCALGSLQPLLGATGTAGYPHGWYVRQLMGDLGDDVLLEIWKNRLSDASQTIETTLRTAIGAAATSFDTTLSRYALRVGLSGRRSGWGVSGIAPFSDAGQFATLSGTKAASAKPDTLALAAGAMQEWIDTAGNATDRIVLWIPDGGANLAHAWISGSASGSERLRGSIRQAASTTRQDVWAFSNPGPLDALREGATSEGSTSYLWTASAPARTTAASGQKLTWTDSAGAVLSGTPTLDTACTPLLHTDVWTPVSSEDPFAASVLSAGGGHALVLEDADRALSLVGATLAVPYASESVWTGRGDGVWTRASASSSGASSTISLGALDLSIPLRILLSTGETSLQGTVPNRSVPWHEGSRIHFPVASSSGGASLEIRSARGDLVRGFSTFSGQAEIVWDLRDGSGRGVRPGVYLYVWRGTASAHGGKLIVAD